jgi:hypothetical protein
MKSVLWLKVERAVMDVLPFFEIATLHLEVPMVVMVEGEAMLS